MNNKLLYGLFTTLRENDISLCTADFLDGVRALDIVKNDIFDLANALGNSEITIMTEKQKGSRSTDSRVVITWLCQTLWARSNEEREKIADIVSTRIPYINDNTFLNIVDALEPPVNHLDENFEEPPPKYPLHEKDTEEEKEKENKEKASADQQQPSESNNPTVTKELPDNTDSFSSYSEEPKEILDNSDIEANLTPEEKDQMDLAKLWDKYQVPVLDPEYDTPKQTLVAPASYIFDQPKNPSFYTLVTLWRRLFRTKKIDDPKKIDINKTTLKLCTNGYLLKPEFKQKNQRLSTVVLFIDMNSTMSPWKDIENNLATSLTSNLTPVTDAFIYYFNKNLNGYIFDDPSDETPTDITAIIKRHPRSKFIIYSDAGAVSNFMSGNVFEGIKKFITRSIENEVGYLLWINPMPKHRWINSWKSLVAKYPFIFTSDIDINSLIQTTELIKCAEQ